MNHSKIQLMCTIIIFYFELMYTFIFTYKIFTHFIYYFELMYTFIFTYCFHITSTRKLHGHESRKESKRSRENFPLLGTQVELFIYYIDQHCVTLTSLLNFHNTLIFYIIEYT